MSVGKNIRKYRKSLGLTQEKLAKKINVIQSNVYRWENDIVIPSIKTVIKLAKVLKVSTDSLLLRNKKQKK